MPLSQRIYSPDLLSIKTLAALIGLFAISIAALPALAQKPATPAPTGTPPVTKEAPAAPADKASKPAAAATMQLRKEMPGEFSYQFLAHGGDASAPAPLPAPAGADNIIALAVPSDIKPAEARLQILDNARGNLARLPVVTTGVTPLTESSFKFVQRVSVPVQSKGRGVEGAQVTLSTADKKESQNVLLQAADNGVATFRNVPLGEPVTVTIRFGAHPPEMQTKTLTLDHPADGYKWPAVSVEWTDIKTVEAPATPAAAAPATSSRGEAVPGSLAPTPVAPAPSPANPVNTLLNFIMSLAILGGVGYGLFWAYKNGHIKTLFDRIGVQTEPATAGGPQPDPFAKPEKPPIQPITEGTADPLLNAAVVGNGGASSYTPVASGPRLVATMGAYAGNIFPLNGPSADIGRDTNNAVPLANDTNASRRHATIQVSNGQYLVTDNGSSNGTFVNGVRIVSQTPQPLHPGDEVQIGQTRFRFEA